MWSVLRRTFGYVDSVGMGSLALAQPIWPEGVSMSSERSVKDVFGLYNTRWRRRRDSNPRDPYGPNGFQDRRFQPLTHSSVSKYIVLQLWAGFLLTIWVPVCQTWVGRIILTGLGERRVDSVLIFSSDAGKQATRGRMAEMAFPWQDRSWW